MIEFFELFIMTTFPNLVDFINTIELEEFITEDANWPFKTLNKLLRA